MNHRRVICFALLACCLTIPAQAQVPPSGSHYQPLPGVMMRKPLMVIRFNQRRVNYDRDLRKAIAAAEKAKPEMHYDVVSIVPAGANSREQASRLNSDAGSNLANVVQSMQDFGVPTWRIRTSAQAAPSVKTQEVHIFVN